MIGRGDGKRIASKKVFSSPGSVELAEDSVTRVSKKEPTAAAASVSTSTVRSPESPECPLFMRGKLLAAITAPSCKISTRIERPSSVALTHACVRICARIWYSPPNVNRPPPPSGPSEPSGTVSFVAKAGSNIPLRSTSSVSHIRIVGVAASTV